MNKQPGRFIVFEGIDGSGKSTIARLLSAYLRRLGIEVVETKHPGGSDFGRALRSIMFETIGTKNIEPKALDILFLADHIQNCERVIKPALAAGKWVIADRHWPVVNTVYSQIRTQDQFSAEITDRYRGPDYDLLFLLDGDPAKLLERARSRETETHQSAKVWNTVEAMQECQQRYYALLCPYDPLRLPPYKNKNIHVKVDTTSIRSNFINVMYFVLRKNFDLLDKLRDVASPGDDGMDILNTVLKEHGIEG